MGFRSLGFRVLHELKEYPPRDVRYLVWTMRVLAFCEARREFHSSTWVNLS